MVIKSVEPFILRWKTDEMYGASSKGLIPERSALLVKITTDDGLVGWGEAGQTSYPELPKAVIDTLYADAIMGEDPFDTEKIWERLYHITRDYGQSGIAVEAISGIDIALWDIKGKAVGLPVHKLLGGRFRDKILAYPCGLYHRPVKDPIPLLREEACRYIANGFRAIKMKIGCRSLREDFQTIEAIRDAVGPDVFLMADANHAYNAYTAVMVGRELERQGFMWFEEPVPPEDIRGYAEVKEKLDIAVTGGECLYTRFGFRPLLEARAVDIVQPDTTTAGGLTECKKIAAMANACGIQYIPHVWPSAVGLAAAIQLIASLPDCPTTGWPQPLFQTPVLEFDQNPNPLREELLIEPITQSGGYVAIPTAPGLGIQVDEKVIEKYMVS